MNSKAVFVPIGNAGNITAVMSGFLKLLRLGVIDVLPRIFGVQSEHADPVFRYYAQDSSSRRYEAVKVRPSVPQAAMIGNPVSFPRVAYLADQYVTRGGSFQVVQVSEQRIIDSMLLANRHGHIACTQGGECLAGLLKARELGLMDKDELAVLDATAHALKFSGFQDMYFQNAFGPEYGISPDENLANAPRLVIGEEEKNSLPEEDFTVRAAENVVGFLGLDKK
jgi:threonine synthase